MIDQLAEKLDLGDELFWEPARVVPPGPWAGHLPAAFWLVKTVRPATFVELGAHSGNSYFAFCKAIAAADAGGRAFAVDTWQGDEHAGHYGEEVFADVSAFNDAHFKSFSTLLRNTFDDARHYFVDGSVDLLHIDGMHCYEAVQHDFETWRPALSNRAVVVFHDTNVRERGFGVWRLWAELSAQYPSFEFHHSHGLGVLGVGAEQSPALRALFETAHDPDAAALTRRLFAARGEAFQHQVQSLAVQLDAQAAIGRVHQEAAATRDEAARERDQLGRRLDEESKARNAAEDARKATEDALHYQKELLAAIERVIATKDQLTRMQAEELQVRDAALQARDVMLNDRDDAIRARDAALRDSADVLRVHEQEVRTSTDALHASRAEAEAAAHQASATQAAAAREHIDSMMRLEQAYMRSTSWRVTAPIRTALRMVRGGSPAGPIFVPPDLSTVSQPFPITQAALTHPSPQDEAAADLPAPPNHRVLLRSLLSIRLNSFLSGNAVLTLPPVEGTPDVSILLVLYNQAELTLGCLESIAATLPGSGVKAEVLVLDNASTDRTDALLNHVQGAAHVVRSAWNMHFLHGVNELAGFAKGRHILLLNNDAQLLPGALRAALDVLDEDASVGAVGGRIIQPDGTLQEAGSVVWNDGTCEGYGRGGDPENPDFMFRRDVDYCSGAFLLTPRAVFERLGRFDPRYAPAYYEEVDYCLRLWQAGLRVVFEPAAAILHFEFGSAGSEEGVGLQKRNLAVFRARHASWLRGQAPSSPRNMLAASRRVRPDARRVLMLEDRVPNPELGAGYPRSHRILRELVEEGAEVTFFPMFRHAETWEGVRGIVGPNVQVMIHAGAHDLRKFLVSRRGEFDAILVCRPHNMQAFLDAVGPDRQELTRGAWLIYDAEAVFARRRILEVRLGGGAIPEAEASRLMAQEVALTQAADDVLSVSPAELQVFQQHGVKSVRLLGHALDVAPTETEFAARDGFIFFGAVPDDRAPNADSLRWFAHEVLPLLRERLGRPDLRLGVAGHVAAQSIQAMGGDTLDLLGQVPDLASKMEGARVMIVPTRFAAGIPHKAHQAAALGVPMVVTELIRDQLGWQDGQELLAARNAAAFSDACARLHEDAALWGQIRDGALERVRAECSPERFRGVIRETLAAVPVRPAEALHPERRSVSAAEQPVFVGRPEDADASVAVPFGYPPTVVSAPQRVAAVCHMFYPEVNGEVLAHLQNIPFAADIFISTDTEEKSAALKAVFASWNRGAVELRVLPNRGRDIAPKLVGFRDVHESYDYVLHLHSKQSRHANFLTPWRTYLYKTLLGSPAVIRSVFEAFERVPTLGLVAPQHFEPVRRWLDWSGNFAGAQALAARMGIELHPDAALDFPSGSMFWARTAALRPLLDLNLSFDEFAEETGQVDGTLAHAVERLYFHVCERAGHRWMKITDPALVFDTQAVVQVRSPDALMRFVDEHGADLASGRLTRRSEPPPLKVQTPPGLLDRDAGTRVPTLAEQVGNAA